MALTLLPVSAMAEGENYDCKGGPGCHHKVAKINDDSRYDDVVAHFDTLTDAIQNGQMETPPTFKLLNDLTEDVVVPAHKNIYLDLNGHKLTNASGHTITVENGGKLNISDSVGTGVVDNTSHGKAAIYNEGEVTLNGGTFERSKEAGKNASENGGNSFYTVLNHGVMTVEDGVTIKNTGKYSSLFENGYQNYNNRDGIEWPALTITGGTLDGGLNTVKNDEGGVLEITGGEIKNSAQACVLNWNKAIITAGTFTLSSGEATVMVGKYSAQAVGDTKISGGTFTAPNDIPMIAHMFVNGTDYGVDTSTSITGGTFSGNVAAYIPSDYIQGTDGTVAQLGENNAVAKVGDTYYKTLAEAVAAADNTTVTLLKDTTENVTIPTGKTITLDLNGKTLTHSGWLSVENGSDLILANGSINADIWVSGGKTAAQTTKLTIGSDVVLSGSFPIVVEGGTNLGSGKGTYGFSKVEIAGTVKATSSGVWVMGNLGNGAESMAQMTMNSNVIDVQSTAKIIGVGNDNLGVTIMGLATVNVAASAEISGSEGIFVKRGTLNINGGTISGNRSSFTLPPNANNNGAEEVGAALVISSTYNNYGTIDVNINGGTFTSAYGNAVYVGHTVNKNSSVNAFVNGYQLDIAAGYFKGAAGKDALNIAESIEGDNSKCKTSVTSGLFSSDPSAYIDSENYHIASSDNGSYPYAVLQGKQTSTPIIVKDDTSTEVKLENGETKTAINNVIDKTKVDGVAEAIADNKAALIPANVDTTGAKKVEIEVTVKVNVTGADMTSENKTLTFEAKPVATIKVDGAEKATGVPVTNDMLNGQPITVKLPLPTVGGQFFTPKQILHKFTGGGYEYFINESVGGMRGAGSFKIEDNCAVFTIYGFSTFELSGTVTYVEPSSGGGSSSSSRRYDVSAPSVKHGDVTVSPKTASKGDTVTITVKPDSGYELDTLTVKDASGSKIKVKDKGNGKFTFTMPASKVTVSAEFAEIETLDFADVSTDAYYYEAVKWAAKKGITGGTGDGTFNPNGSCTRAHIVTFLWRAAGSPEPKSTVSFADVPAGSYYAKAVAWAVENGITLGTGDGTFSPNATCTRAQSVTFLYRAMGTAPTTVNGFTDVTADAFYADAVAWAVESGVTNGTSASTFSPNNGCTRAQIVTFLYRTMK